jgi:hypothetical protein
MADYLRSRTCARAPGPSRGSGADPAEEFPAILDSMTDQLFSLSSDWRFTCVDRNAAEQMRLLGMDSAWAW